MRNLALTIAYNGAAFAGWQYQPDLRTVQGEVEKALAQITQQPARVRGAGRTDAGVHARAQVANVRLEHTISCGELVRALNALLPADVVIRAACEVPAEFRARRDNQGKHYRYRWWNGQTFDLNETAFSVQIRRPLALEKMANAAQQFVGSHDFSAFRAADCDRETTVRTLFRCTISRSGQIIMLDIQGTAFLKNMIRIIAGTLVQIGNGKREPGEIAQLLAEGNRCDAGPTAPPNGLALMRVYTPWTNLMEL